MKGVSEWRTLAQDRAEPRQSALWRPDSAFVGKVDTVDNTLAAWPTKLTLCPDLGDQLQRQLDFHIVRPRHQPKLLLLAHLGQPPIAQPIWETLFQ